MTLKVVEPGAATTAEVVKKSRKSNPNRGSKPGERRGGRKKGTPNKLTADLKNVILEAAEGAHKDGTVGYLKQVAKEDQRTFCALLGKVLPLTVQGDKDNPLFPETVQIKFVRPKP